MNSRMNGSEKVLAKLACKPISNRQGAKVVIGGLGMGFTLASALIHLQSHATVIQVELLPAMVQWHEQFLGHLCDHAVKDGRVEVVTQDIVHYLNTEKQTFDAIILDVDNGPGSMAQEGNDELYSLSGVSMIHRALRPGGVVAVWSASPDSGFTQRLKTSSFHVIEHKVRGRTQKKGPVHTIWIAKKSC